MGAHAGRLSTMTDFESVSMGWRLRLEYSREPVELTLGEVVERLCRLDGDVAYREVDGRVYAYFRDEEISSEECSFNLGSGSTDYVYD